MTNQQIQYWSIQEQKRHNIASEEQNWYSIKEAQRHNIVSEDLGFKNLAETSRHNVVSESLGFANLAETSRHNRATEWTANQQVRLGFANLAETQRHNRFNEELGAVTEYNTRNINLYNAQTRRLELQQTELRDQRNYELGVGNYLVNAVGALSGSPYKALTTSGFSSSTLSTSAVAPSSASVSTTTSKSVFGQMLDELEAQGR
jgi:hypothetical protein